MGVLKFLERFLGGFLILLALTIIFTGLFVQYSLDNISILAKSAETKIPKILQENRDLFAENIFKKLKVDRNQLGMACLEKPEEFPGDFCSKLKTLETEDDIKDELINVMILKMQEQMQPEVVEFEQEIKSKVDRVRSYLSYLLPVGLFILLLGSFLIFLAEKFKCKPTLYYVSLKTGIISAFISIGNYFLKSLTPDRLEEIAKALPMVKEGEAPGLALKLMSALLTDWINVVAEKLFLISVTIAAVSLSITIIMFILKRKKPVKAVKEKKSEAKVKKVSATKKESEKILSQKSKPKTVFSKKK